MTACDKRTSCSLPMADSVPLRRSKAPDRSLPMRCSRPRWECVTVWCYEANRDDSLSLNEQRYDFVRKDALASSAKRNPREIVVAAKKKLILHASCRISSGKPRFKAAANSSNSVGPRVKASEIRISLTRRVTRRFCVCVYMCGSCLCVFVCVFVFGLCGCGMWSIDALKNRNIRQLLTQPLSRGCSHISG